MDLTDLQSKGERTRRKLIEAAIESVAQNGFEYSSVTTIAKLSKLNRGLVVHYFSKIENLLAEANATVVDYIVRYSTEYMNSHTEIPDLIERYISSTFGWIRERPRYGQYALLLISRSHYEARAKKPIELIFSSGRARVEKLILIGIEQGQYKAGDANAMAYQVHTALLGHLLIYLYETRELERSHRAAIESARQILTIRQ